MKEFDLNKHIERHIEFSKNAFGPDYRLKAILDHIRKELVEVENDPHDLEEWIDVISLAIDGAWRSGHSPEQISEMLAYKQQKNENRKWPDWRLVDPDKPMEHIKE